MALPSAVERQAQEADELMAQLQGQGNTEEAPQETEEEVPLQKEEEEPKVEEKAEEPTPEPDPKPETPDPKEYERLQQAHRVLQGKYNAEVPRMHERIRQLEEQLATANKAPVKADEVPAPKTLDGVLKKLKEDYGDEFAGNVSELIDSRIDSKLSMALKSVNENVASVATTVAKTREEKFNESLDRLVPTWRDVFNDPRFSDEFLERVEPLSGLTLRELALDANRKSDAPRLSKIYNAFIAENAKGESKPEQKEVPKVDKREALITPATGTKQNTAVKDDRPDYIRASDMNKFYNDMARGVYKHRPKEAEAMEARINKAIVMGWIVEG